MKELEEIKEKSGEAGEPELTEASSSKKHKKIKELSPQKRRLLVVLISIFSSVAGIVGIAFIALSAWYQSTFNVSFKDLLYTLTSPTKGTGQGTISDIAWAVLPAAIIATLVFATAFIVLARRKRIFDILRSVVAGVCALTLAGSMVFTTFAFRIPEYIYYSFGGETTIYEDYYIDPKDVVITADGKTKNLIYIYCESMETTYASLSAGGRQLDGNNYIPKLTELTKEGITFTNKREGQLGGFHTVQGTGWTIASLMSTTSGTPFAFSAGENNMNEVEHYAPNLTTLGDVLEEKGYRQMFLCGSDATFGGRRNYFTQHGNYEIYDLYTAWEDEESGVEPGKRVWWGYEDFKLFDIAKKELTKMASEEGPFNFTMLTVDAHHVNGYVCEKCGEKYDGQLKNVLNCTDTLVYDFVKWCQQQDFYEDSVIVISGDHPRMDVTLVKNISLYDRTIYNCILNSAIEPEKKNTVNREFSAMDMFPTTLAAMGFTVEGECLGFGTNMFSGQKTIMEQRGYTWLNRELSKDSAYYKEKFE